MVIPSPSLHLLCRSVQITPAQGVHPLLSTNSEQGMGYLMSSSSFTRGGKGEKTNGVMPPPNDKHLNCDRLLNKASITDLTSYFNTLVGGLAWV